MFLNRNLIVDVGDFRYLEKLETLFLNENKIKRIQGLQNLTNLKVLNLDNNRISEIEKLKKLKNLKSLSIRHNHISSIPNTLKLPNLVTVFLGYNPIKMISSLSFFPRVEVIELCGLKIEDLSLIDINSRRKFQVFWNEQHIINGQLPRESDRSKDYSYITIEGETTYKYQKGIHVKNCHNLKKPAPEWVMLGPEMVREYFRAIEAQGEEVMNEVKVLLIGDGGAGKTSLAYRLTKPNEELPKEEQRTRGVDIYDWKYQRNKKSHLIHIWDFGGQVMYDMVHQYFYSQRALYILMDSSRSGANEHDSRLNQLLQSAELFGRNSQMIMIQNEHTGHEKKMDFTVLKKNYPFLTDYCKVNLSTKEGLDELKTILKKHIDKIPGMGVVMPKLWMRVRKEIQKLTNRQSTLELKKFREICTKNGITNEKGQNILSRYFHQLGVFLHFQGNPSSALAKLIILNREWATKASYKVFDSSSVMNANPKGTFRLEHLAEFWPEKEFSDFHSELLDLMKQFEICFELRSTKKYLVPRMMDKIPDVDYCQSEEHPLKFYYEYTFMPEGLLNRLSVRLHEMIGGTNGDLVWSDGVVFQEKGLTAELREIRQPDTNRIQIKVVGKDAHWMSETLIREIDKINENFNLERLKVQTLIPCICDTCRESDDPYYFDYRRVKGDLQKPDPKFHSYYCEKTRAQVDYHELLKTISHGALKEVEEIQNQNKIGHFRGEDEISFRGKGGLEMAERMMTQDTSEIQKGIEELKTHVQKEGVETRKQVKTQAEQTRSEVSRKLDEIPQILRENIKKSEERMLGEMLKKLDEVELEFSYASDLIEKIEEGITAAFHKQPTQEDLLKAFQQAMINKKEGGDNIKINEKLKVSIWLIPTLLKYEADVPVNIRQKIKEFWKKGGLGNVIL